jgi:hypothetical protein
MLLPALLAALVLSPAPAPPPVEIPPAPALAEAIAARDARLFGVMFEQCDPAALVDLVTGDMEFYHDKGGRMAHDAFIADYAKTCAAKRPPDAWRSRRELIAGSMKVYAIPGFGAVEEGGHVFYERKGDGPERLAGKARFSILWKLEPDGQWRMARTFSIDHAAVE